MLKFFHISAIPDLFILYEQDLMPYQRWQLGEPLQPGTRSRPTNSVAFVCERAQVVLSLTVSSTDRYFFVLLVKRVVPSLCPISSGFFPAAHLNTLI